MIDRLFSAALNYKLAITGKVEKIHTKLTGILKIRDTANINFQARKKKGINKIHPIKLNFQPKPNF